MISAVVLTHNDEQMLERTLVSLSWCDEVIVVDDESTDKTREIAKKFTPHVFVHPLNDDFAAQRNFGLSKARESWILFVDSDEVITPLLADEIIALTKYCICRNLSNGTRQCAGYYVKRKDYFGGRWLKYGETSQVKLLRLARKNSGKWERAVHEVWKVQGSTSELVNPLEHFPHQNVAHFLNEINRYSTINAKYLYTQGVRVPWWHVVAYPKAKFFQNYFLRMGFLDGTAGIVIALMMSFHSFLTHAKLWLLWHPHE